MSIKSLLHRTNWILGASQIRAFRVRILEYLFVSTQSSFPSLSKLLLLSILQADAFLFVRKNTASFARVGSSMHGLCFGLWLVIGSRRVKSQFESNLLSTIALEKTKMYVVGRSQRSMPSGSGSWWQSIDSVGSMKWEHDRVQCRCDFPYDTRPIHQTVHLVH